MKNTSFILAYGLIIICSIFKFCSNLTFAEIVPTPIVTPTPWLITEDATNITSSSATLNATVPIIVGYIYFEYGTASGSYTNSVGAVREDTSEKVSADISV